MEYGIHGTQRIHSPKSILVLHPRFEELRMARLKSTPQRYNVHPSYDDFVSEVNIA
jgi:hypothetical protein